MQLALNLLAPAIEGALWRHATGFESVRLSVTGAPIGDVDALQTPLVGTQPPGRIVAQVSRAEMGACLRYRRRHFSLRSCGGTPGQLLPWRIGRWHLRLGAGHDAELQKAVAPELGERSPGAVVSGRHGGLEGKTLGVLLGCNAISQVIARRDLAFDMRIVAKVRQHRLSPMAGVELVASLDVVDPEPLLASHWLYTHPACVSVPIYPGAHRAWWSRCRAFFCAIWRLLPTGDGWSVWRRMWQPVIEGGGTRLP